MRTAIVIVALTGVAGVAWVTALAVDPAPFAPLSALLVAIGIASGVVVAVAGITLAHAPWARWLGLGTLAAAAGVGSLGTPGSWAVVATGLTAAAVVGLTGPWLRAWLRRRPPALGPGPLPTALALAALGLSYVVGVSAPTGPGAPAVALGLSGPVLAWWYSRSSLPALWTLRVLPGVLAVADLAADPGPGAVARLAAAATVTGLAWRRECRAVVVGAPTLPAPRRARRDP